MQPLLLLACALGAAGEADTCAAGTDCGPGGAGGGHVAGGGHAGGLKVVSTMTVSFADGFDINDHVTAGSPPVVMTGMPQIWPAFQWTWDELNEKMLAGGVPEVRHSTETALFPYYTANTTIPAPRPPTVPSMPADDFFENLEASEDWAPADGPREHLYFSQSMAHPGLKAL